MTKTILAGVLGAFLCAGAAGAEPCKLTLLASLDIDSTIPNRVMIDAKIQDLPVKMIVDTGATQTIVQESVATQFNFHRIRVSQHYLIEDYQGQRIDQVAVVPSLTTGNLHASDVHALIRPRPFQSPAVGAVGPDMLMHYDIEFDFAANKMNLFSQYHCPGQVVYWTHDPVAAVPLHEDSMGHLLLNVMLDGKTVEAALDTGAPASSMKLADAIDDFGVTVASPNLVKDPDGYYLYRFKQLALGGIAISNPQVYLSGPASRPKGGPKLPFLFGLKEMRRMHLFVSYKEHVLYATAPDAH